MCMVHVQTIPRRFEAQTVVHKQRVDRWNKMLINSDHWGLRNWHIQFENIGHYRFTGSEMKPFLVKLECVVNSWTCSFFLPFGGAARTVRAPCIFFI